MYDQSILKKIIKLKVINGYLQIVVPRGPIQAKGLLLSCIEDPDPCIIFEPKALYRAAIDDVPTGEFKTSIGKAEILREGEPLTFHLNINSQDEKEKS